MMDDGDPFERQLANVVRQAMRPPRPVDALAYRPRHREPVGRWAVVVRRFRGDLAPTPPEGGSPIFAALRLLAAAAIVALCGGFLLVTFATPQAQDGVPAAATSGPATVATSYTMTSARPSLTAMLLRDGRVLLAGRGEQRVSADLFDPGSGVFTSVDSFPSDLDLYSAAPLRDGRLLFLGPVGHAWLYDPPTGTFDPVEGATVAGPDSATPLLDGRVLILGFDPEDRDSAAELFDPVTDTFTPVEGAAPYASGPALRTLDGRILILGSDNAGELVPAVYDPAGGTFARIGEIDPGPWRAASSTLLADGRVLLAGGQMWVGGSTQASLFDPVTGKSTPTGAMIEPRYDHSATLLPDGRVLIAGGGSSRRIDGRNGLVVLASAELYDPVTGTFTPTGAMTAARRRHTATLLPDERVLIVGGLATPTTDQSPLVSAELYDPATGTFSRIGSVVVASMRP
jgi:hypothetical protein